MTEHFESKALAFPDKLSPLVSASVDRAKLRFDPEDGFLFYPDLATFKAALAESGVTFLRSEVRDTTQTIDIEKQRDSGWLRGRLKNSINCIVDHPGLKTGLEVALYQMDRPFLIKDGIVETRIGSISLSFEATNGGCPGDYILIDLSNRECVISVAKEWIEKNVSLA